MIILIDNIILIGLHKIKFFFLSLYILIKLFFLGKIQLIKI